MLLAHVDVSVRACWSAACEVYGRVVDTVVSAIRKQKMPTTHGLMRRREHGSNA